MYDFVRGAIGPLTMRLLDYPLTLYAAIHSTRYASEFLILDSPRKKMRGSSYPI